MLFREQAASVPPSAKDDLQAAFVRACSAGITVAYGGAVFAPATQVQGAGEAAGVVVALVVLAVLAVALGSLVAAGFPLLTALAGVAIGVLTVLFLARFIQLTSTAAMLATMVGLALGIDYALFIVSRHREQLADPRQEETDSIARATATGGSAVVFAGATVVVALAALAAAQVPFLTAMGLAAAGTVTLAVLIAVTLVPALLGFAGERLRPGQPTPGGRGQPGCGSGPVPGRTSAGAGD